MIARLRAWRRPALRGAGPLPWDRLAHAVGLAVVLGLPVAALALLVRLHESPVVAWDERMIAAATDVTRAEPALRAVLVAWQAAFQAVWVNLVAAGICVWITRRHGLRNRAVWAFATIMTSWALALGLKHVVQRARPVVDDAVALAPGYSFPSGHAANTATAALAVVVLLWPVLGARGRAVALALGAAVVVVTGLDRVMLGVHYPSDVVAGIAFGAAVVGASHRGFVGRAPARRTDPVSQET